MSSKPAASAAALPLDRASIRTIVIGVMLAMFLAALDQTIVATALPTIGAELGDLEHLPWVVTAYLLTATAVIPLYGKLSDIHGRRITILVGIGIFIAGSLLCALAPGMATLIGGRAVQGLGGGGLISLAQTTIADVVSPRERVRYQGYIASVFVSASIFGPVLGGVFAQHLHWSLIFWINLPLGTVAFALAFVALRRLPRHERPHRVDITGAILMVTATVAFLLALSWGGTRYPWLSPPTLGLVTLAAVLAILFAVRLVTAAEPLLPPAILFNPVVSRGTAAASFAMGTFIGLAVFIPIYFEAVLRLPASQSGMALIPLMGGVILGASIASRLMARLRHYKRPPLVGLASASVALAALAVQPSGLPFYLTELLLAVVGTGIGTLLPVATVAIQNAVEPHQLGTATAVMNFFRSLAGAVVVAGFGAIVLGSAAASGVRVEQLAAAASNGAVDLDSAYRWTFLTAAVGLAIALAWLRVMAELPLRTRVATAPPPSDGSSEQCCSRG